MGAVMIELFEKDDDFGAFLRGLPREQSPEEVAQHEREHEREHERHYGLVEGGAVHHVQGESRG
jgi:hypothetical protein